MSAGMGICPRAVCPGVCPGESAKRGFCSGVGVSAKDLGCLPRGTCLRVWLSRGCLTREGVCLGVVCLDGGICPVNVHLPPLTE